MKGITEAEPGLTLQLGRSIYRACCLEEVQIAPGRIAEMKIVKLNIERDAVLLRRVWDDGSLCKPVRHTASWLVTAGWRDTPQEAAAAGVVYLKRQIEDARRIIATSEAVIAVLAAATDVRR